MFSKIPMTIRKRSVNNQLCITFFLLAFLFCCDTDYEDRFALTPPDSQQVSFIYPGIASIKFIQTTGTSSTYPAKNTHLKAVVTRLNSSATGPLIMSMNAYLKTPLTSENIGFTQIINVTQFSTVDTVTIDLGSSYSIPLKKELVQLEIVNAALAEDDQSKLRGNYTGIYTIEKDDEVLMQGLLSGVINYKGETSLEVSGVDAFSFVKGLVILIDDEVHMQYAVMDKGGAVVAPLVGVASMNEDVLVGKLHLSIPQYDSLKITVIKN